MPKDETIGLELGFSGWHPLFRSRNFSLPTLSSTSMISKSEYLNGFSCFVPPLRVGLTSHDLESRCSGGSGVPSCGPSFGPRPSSDRQSVTDTVSIPKLNPPWSVEEGRVFRTRTDPGEFSGVFSCRPVGDRPKHGIQCGQERKTLSEARLTAIQFGHPRHGGRRAPCFTSHERDL